MKTQIDWTKVGPELLEACKAVTLWAKTPGDHAGNPYLHDFVNKAEKAINKTEEK